MNILRRHPVATFLVITIGFTWTALVVSLLAGWDLTPAKLAELVVLVGTATLVTAWTGGRAAVRRLFAGVVKWRIGVGIYLLVLAAVPVLTLLIAAATGTLRSPPGGWPAMIGIYLLFAVVFGALLGNVWEETAWAGFVQKRLMSRHGLLVGSLLTAIPFALIHLPLAFEEHGLKATTWGQAAATWALLIGAAPFVRYLVGMLLIDTGGSLLAVGLLHGSWNASSQLAAADGGWQFIPAVVVLTLLVAGYRLLRVRTVAGGRSGHVDTRTAAAV
jgi:membrane protease YdiL (CAAX protease family)